MWSYTGARVATAKTRSPACDMDDLLYADCRWESSQCLNRCAVGRCSIDHGHAVSDFESSPPQITSDIQLVDDSGQSDGSDQDSKLARCQEIIEYQFRDESLLLSALTHASGASNRLASNERLEFLGDAVLGLTVCQWLYEEYPEYNEGDLTKIKSAVVSRRSCGKIACSLGLDRCLIVGRGVTRNRSFPRSLVSDVFESVVAAIYLDGGAETAADRIKKWMRPKCIWRSKPKVPGISSQRCSNTHSVSWPAHRFID